MAIPTKATGGGNNSIAQNVFRVTYSTALSSQPRWEAYDSVAVFPAVGTATTSGNTIFTGTTGNTNLPMLSLVATTSAAPVSAWKPVGVTVGSANPNRLRGATNTVLDPTTPSAGASIRFNLVLEIPFDATPSSTMAHDLLNRYTYTGVAPSLTWAVNDNSALGTEATPVWTTLTPGTHGIRYCRTGTISGGPYLLTIPTSGTVDSGEIWVSAT